MSPKPILKRSVSNNHEQPLKTIHHHTHRHLNRNHGVHFPPPPSLTCTFSAYSSVAYDRSPIVVSPNNCALPERGCPGRTYTLEESAAQQPSRGISYARDFHPRALAFASRSSSPRSTRTPIDAAVNERSSYYPSLPQLIPDLSSESDESDGFSSTPSASTAPYSTFGIHGLAGHPSKYNADSYSGLEVDKYTPCVDDSNALAFLPYPPSPPSHKYQYAESIDPCMQNTRRRRGERRSKHGSSRDPGWIPSSEDGDTQHCALAFSSLSISSPSISSVTPKKRSPKKRLATSQHPYSPVSHSPSNFGSLDDGCLGGFWNHKTSLPNALYYYYLHQLDWNGLVVPISLHESLPFTLQFLRIVLLRTTPSISWLSYLPVVFTY